MPWVISHARGDTTFHGIPERIVASGSQWLITTVALGVSPVGYIENVAPAMKLQLCTTPPQSPVFPVAQ